MMSRAIERLAYSTWRLSRWLWELASRLEPEGAARKFEPIRSEDVVAALHKNRDKLTANIAAKNPLYQRLVKEKE